MISANEFRRKAMEAAVVPFPIPEITPPDTKIYFNFLSLFLIGTIYNNKFALFRQLF